MIKHVVSFRLKGEPAEKLAVAGEFKKALEALPSEIECLKSMEVGINCNPAESWDIVLTAVVDNFNDLSSYSNHPLHLAATQIIKD